MSMRNPAVLAAILAIAPLQMPAQNASPGKRSVVKITASIGGGVVGTGFMWSDRSHVVTALHVVAGAPKITVYAEALGQLSSAQIQAVNLEADLALLKLDNQTTFDLPLLRSASGPPDLSAIHRIWGYPLDIAEIISRTIRFSEGMNDNPTMASIFKNSRDFENAVGPQGYPRFQTRVLRVESTIVNGHSGAPILDQDGAVVGIADGGLDQGIKGRNWAIPAAVYLRSIGGFHDPIPSIGNFSAKATLMGARTSQSVNIDRGAATTGAANRAYLHWAWSGRLSDIVRTLPSDEQEDYWQLARGVDRDRFLAGIIDVYEDSLTRATIAVPRGVNLTFSPESHYLQATTAGGNLSLSIQLKENKTRNGAVDAWKSFDQWIRSRGNWQQDKNYKTVIEGDKAGDYNVKRHWVVLNNGVPVAWLQAELDIDGSDFLGTAVFAGSNRPFTAAELVMYRWMEACSMLSDFGN
jgi:S1-C subfamily serine protease